MEFAFQILHIGPKIRLVFAIAADIKVSNLKVRLEEAILSTKSLNSSSEKYLEGDLVMVSNMFMSGSRSSLSVSVILLNILPISLPLIVSETALQTLLILVSLSATEYISILDP